MNAALRLSDPTTSPLTLSRGGLAPLIPVRMDINTCSKRFWQFDGEAYFTGTETRLYFYWVNRFNAAFWPLELAHTCRQVEADLGFDDKTHSKARAGLEARGLLFYQAGDKRTKARWSLTGKPRITPQMPRKNSDQSEHIAPQVPRSFSDENTPITPQMPRKNSDPYIEQTKTCSRTINPNQKKGGEGALDSSPSASQKITAPTPVAPPPFPAAGHVVPCLEPGTDASKSLAAELATLWHISEGKNPRRWAQFTTFTRTLAAAGRLDEARQQFEAYRLHRQLRGISPHSVDNYLGHELSGYSDGAWCDCDWVATAADAKPKPTAFGPAAVPARASASPSTQKTTWS